MLKRETFGETAPGEDAIGLLVSLTQHVFGEVERELKLAGFWESIPAQNKLKADIQRTLIQLDFAKLPSIVQNRARIISRVMEIAEAKSDTILYAP
jgi:type I restriction enzyme R subunit